MNIPGTTGGNWRWRFTRDMLTDKARARLRELTRQAGR
jgi:4-alpha-glucanotransferase